MTHAKQDEEGENNPWSSQIVVGTVGQSEVVVKGNPVVHRTHPDAVGHGNVDVEVETPKELQPQGAVTNSESRNGTSQ